MITVTDSTPPNAPGKDYYQLQSPEPDYQVTGSRKLRLPSRGSSASDHHVDVQQATSEAPVTIIGCSSSNALFNVPLVDGGGNPITLVVTSPGMKTFHCRQASTPSGWEWVQA